ncbi:hypothetical protein BJX76DRAFT_361998 [Aspergillus varians]
MQKENLELDPPILFKPRSHSAVTAYPIDPNVYDPGNIIGGAKLDFMVYNPPDKIENIHHTRWSPGHRANTVADYLTSWALGRFPRKLPNDVADLGRLYHITPITMSHPIIPDTPGFGGGRTLENWWRSEIYEYESRDTDGGEGFLPHIILVTTQSCNGHHGSVIQGELAAIVTAMRNRSRQPTVWECEDSDEDMYLKFGCNELSESELCFKNERRFPVLMVSLVGPQHGRIYYACMKGEELFIR